ncbi:serine/threonine protein kinase [bacterium]|nr:serine/threonine protein kinase [bacterium]QQR58859.1 MAG: serine/threonine protein kinase [Candidatus Melainabacteria bacterium]
MSDPGLGLPCVLNRRWQVVERLGQGGMGTVYLSNDLNLPNLGDSKRSCVVKQLRDDFFRQEDRERAIQFFFREAQVLSALSHPNIVAILDFFQEEGKSYLIMEYVRGKNLHEMLMERGEPFFNEEVIDWAIQVCEVLHYLHTHDPPVIYRDLKPSNIMIDERNQVKLVDFGIARPFEESEDNTHVVSQGYSPPEQYWGAADPRSDVYALGCTMYFLLTGKDSLALTVSNPKKLNADVNDTLDRIVQRATQQDVWSRYQSALEMKEELIFLRSKIQPKAKQSKSKIWIIAAAAIGLVVVSSLVFAKVQSDHEMVEQEAANYRQMRAQAEQEKMLFKIGNQSKQQNNLPSSANQGAFHIQQSKPASSKKQYLPVNDESMLTDSQGLFDR